jgi:hypothetical protein
MEEIIELKTFLEQQNYPAALTLIGEMEEMSKDDKIHKIYSFMIILLLHLIKQKAEGRSTRSWEFSIRNSIREIQLVNKRRKTGGWYLTLEEISPIIDEAYPPALQRASLEVFEGQFSEEEINQKVNETVIKTEALAMIVDIYQNGK